MALPSTGPITLYQMKDYANDGNLDSDVSGTMSINDADVRSLIGKTANSPISFSEFRGVAGVPAKQINITVGVGTYFYATWSGQQTGVTLPDLGSFTTSILNNFYLPINWRGLFHIKNSPNDGLFLRLNQGSNSDFVVRKITVLTTLGFYTYHRSDATYTNLGSGNHSWKWTQANTIFGANGTSATVVWFVGT